MIYRIFCCLHYSKLHAGLNACGVSHLEFNKWKEEITEGFYQKNCYSIPDFLQKLQNNSVADIPRNITFGDYILKQEMRTKLLLQTNFQLNVRIAALEEKIDKLISAVHSTTSTDMVQRNSTVSDDSNTQLTNVSFQRANEVMKNTKMSLGKRIAWFWINKGWEAYQQLPTVEKKIHKSAHSKRMAMMDHFTPFLDESVPSIDTSGMSRAEWEKNASMITESLCSHLHKVLVDKNQLKGNSKLSITLLSQKKKEQMIKESIELAIQEIRNPDRIVMTLEDNTSTNHQAKRARTE